jgi:hypothetical protein
VRALRGDRHGVLVGMTPFGASVWLADSDASVEYVAHAFAESELTTLTRSAPERAEDVAPSTKPRDCRLFGENELESVGFAWLR